MAVKCNATLGPGQLPSLPVSTLLKISGMF